MLQRVAESWPVDGVGVTATVDSAMEPKRSRHDVIRLCAESGRHESAVIRYLDGLPVQRATRTLVEAAAHRLGLAHLLPASPQAGDRAVVKKAKGAP